MQNLLGQLGFTQCGIIHVVEDNYPRYSYEIRKGMHTNEFVCMPLMQMREHRDTMAESSIDRSIDLILQTLEQYISGK